MSILTTISVYHVRDIPNLPPLYDLIDANTQDSNLRLILRYVLPLDDQCIYLYSDKIWTCNNGFIQLNYRVKKAPKSDLTVWSWGHFLHLFTLVLPLCLRTIKTVSCFRRGLLCIRFLRLGQRYCKYNKNLDNLA